MGRPKRTTVKRKGQGIEINFSEKDGRSLAQHLNEGGSLMDIFGTPEEPEETTDGDVSGVDTRSSDGADG